ncbi:hypothetical protein ACOMHN_041266 [Nucella lapillus]
MLSLSLFGTPNTTTTTTKSSPSSPYFTSSSSPSSSSAPSSPMKSGHDVIRAEAVTFLGLLRHNEDHLAAKTKQLMKRDRCFVRELFSARVDEWTPLHACTLRGARKLLKMALKSGVNPDLEMGSPEGLPGRCSPLHLAAYRGDVSLIQILVQNGASLNLRDSTQRAPLHYAASKKNVLAVKKLIKYGADVSELTAEQRVFYKGDIEKRPSSLLCIPVATGSR